MHCKKEFLIDVRAQLLTRLRALPPAEREHFLSLATTEAVKKVKKYDPKLFAPASYDKECAVLMKYHTGAAWAWAVCDEARPSMLLYTDV
jgi:hypothetical protein